MWMRIGFLVICVPTFFIGLFGNLLILIGLFKDKGLRSPFFFYLANIALADLLYIILSTLNIVEYILEEWVLGNVMCRLQYLLINSVHSSSVLTLAVVSIERYLYICKTRSHFLSTKYFKVISMVWLVAIVITSPMGYERTTYSDEKGAVKCRGLYWSLEASIIYYTVLSIILYVIPFSVFVVTHFGIFMFLRVKVESVMELKICDSSSKPKDLDYNQSKSTRELKLRQRGRRKKVFKTLFIVAVAFFTTLFPSVITRFLYLAGVQFPGGVISLSHLLLYLHPTINFIIYISTSTDLRSSVKSVFKNHRQHPHE